MIFQGTWTIGITENPLLDSPFVASWNDDTIVPPPGADLIIMETGQKIVDETGGLYMITES